MLAIQPSPHPNPSTTSTTLQLPIQVVTLQLCICRWGLVALPSTIGSILAAPSSSPQVPLSLAQVLWCRSQVPFCPDSGTSAFRHNPYAWNQNANLVYIDIPEGIGFSPPSNNNITDATVSEDTFQALLKFYEKFPQLKDQSLYLAGEQYAGVTIPIVAANIQAHNRNPYTPAWLRINLKGFLLENPCTMGDDCDNHHSEQLSPATVTFLYNHYYLTPERFIEFYDLCRWPGLPACDNILNQISADFAKTNSNIRNINGKCYANDRIKCLDDSGILEFLNNPKLKTAIHANQNVTFQTCNTTLWKFYNRTLDGSYPQYRTLARDEGLKIVSSSTTQWIVSEVLDGIVPTFSTRKWVDNLKEELNFAPSRLWEGWYYNKNGSRLLGGDGEQIRNLSLITLRTAGFMGLQSYPEIQTYVVNKFINSTEMLW